MVKTIEDAVNFAGKLLALATMSGNGTDASPELTQAIADHDTPTLFLHLTRGLGYQGISDVIARDYASRHGDAEWFTVEQLLETGRGGCEKLEGFDQFVGCGYKKHRHTCAHPGLLPGCPVSRLPLRKGILNEQAFSLYFLIRDRCGGDLVAYVDQTLTTAALEPDFETVGREALLALLTSVRGVSRKVASMMLATVMMSADDNRPRWHRVGKSMVAVDSLVHNFLHRTGMLEVYEAYHPYGPRCYGLQGCELIIRDLAARLSLGSDPYIPPRSLQHAIWWFCASDGAGICNGRRIKDTVPCQQLECPLRLGCALLPLRPRTGEVAP